MREPDLYLISVAARMLDMHPQTLRKYERLGLVRPSRTMGSMRVYTDDELERLWSDVPRVAWDEAAAQAGATDEAALRALLHRGLARAGVPTTAPPRATPAPSGRDDAGVSESVRQRVPAY